MRIAEKTRLPEDSVAVFRVVDGAGLGVRDVESAFTRLSSLTEREREQVPGMPADRAPVIVAGTAILLEILHRFHIDRFHVSLRGLRYGLVIEKRAC